MTSTEISEWMAFYTVENEVTPEDEEAAQIRSLGLSETASAELTANISKRKGRR